MHGAHHVVIIGGGFGGLNVARALRRAPVQVTLLDRRNFHLFQPLLYQVATGGLSPANIAAPLRGILRRQRNARVLLAEATDIDVRRRSVVLLDGEMPYDTLVVATGASHHYFGHDEWGTIAPGLKTIEDAITIRRKLLLAFEAAEREPDPSRHAECLTFVIVGGGPTGVELAGAFAEIARDTLRHDFRSIDPTEARILLVEATDRILPTYVPQLSEKARRALERLGAQVLTNTTVSDVQPDGVTLSKGDVREFVPARTILWAAGVQASPLGKTLAEQTGAELDRVGRLVVEPDMTLRDHPDIIVMGDLAHYNDERGQPLPGVAAVAIQQGKYAGRLIDRRLRGETSPPFRYRDQGSMATIGRASAVADLGWIKLSGYPGWLAWLFVHLANLIGYENRLLVMLQWAWNYFTGNRAARLITGIDSPPR